GPADLRGLGIGDGSLDRVKLIDFGIARRAGQPSSMTRTGAIVGTPGYMSPEQARGEWDVDARADLFSLGCVLYTCLSGRPPFAAAHLLATLTAILFLEPLPVIALNPEIPGALAELVAHMLAKSPDGRPATAAQVAAALADLGQLPDSTRRPFQLLSAKRRAQGDASPPETITTQQSLSLAPRSSDELPIFILAAMDSEPVDIYDDDYSGDDQIAIPAPDLSLLVNRAEAAVTEHAGLSALLADGTFVAMFAGASDRAEQASRAARCAVALRHLLPEAPIVMGMGDVLPAGAVLDRLVETLVEESFRGLVSDSQDAPGRKPIRLGKRIMELLGEDEFHVARIDVADYLIPSAPEHEA
ncbi:MAG: serine/threonine-protein kinase, partial [Myxococcota bacterium]